MWRLAAGVFQAVTVFVADSCSSPAGWPLGGREELSSLCKPTGNELIPPETRGLTVLSSSSCSQRLITWPEQKHVALYAFFFLFQTTLKSKQDPFFGDFYFKTLKRNSAVISS